MSDISKVKLPDNNTYGIKDATARAAIDDIVNGTTQLPYTLVKDANDTAQNLIKLGDGLSLDANNVLSAAGGGIIPITFNGSDWDRVDGKLWKDIKYGDIVWVGPNSTWPSTGYIGSTTRLKAYYPAKTGNATPYQLKSVPCWWYPMLVCTSTGTSANKTFEIVDAPVTDVKIINSVLPDTRDAINQCGASVADFGPNAMFTFKVSGSTKTTNADIAACYADGKYIKTVGFKNAVSLPDLTIGFTYYGSYVDVERIVTYEGNTRKEFPVYYSDADGVYKVLGATGMSVTKFSIVGHGIYI